MLMQNTASAIILTAGDARQVCLVEWLQHLLAGQLQTFCPLSGDASFRRYFRATTRTPCATSYVVMDAPPAREDCVPFVAIARALHRQGLKVPEVYAWDQENGFLLLSDFGDALYLNELKAQNADILYGAAFSALFRLQAVQSIPGYALPLYDAALYQKEMDLFSQWYLQQYLRYIPSERQQAQLQQSFDFLIQVNQEQPQVFVHRDYHSRNLLVLPSGEVGILDFQDGVRGPITYDLMSLLRDCYIDWPLQRVEHWVLWYKQELERQGRLQGVEDATFLRWFFLSGLQRHLKCFGIFARLHLRDGKSGYLQYLPRLFRYAVEVCNRYAELAPLHRFLVEYAQP